MKLLYKNQQRMVLDGEMDVVRAHNNHSYCAAQRLKNGRVVLGDGGSYEEAITLCRIEVIEVLSRPMSRHQPATRTAIASPGY